LNGSTGSIHDHVTPMRSSSANVAFEFGDDEELHVHEAAGGVDLGRHGVDRRLVVPVQRRLVAGRRRQRREVLVLLDHALEPPRPAGVRRLEAVRGHAAADEAVDARLLGAPALREAEVADDEVQHHPEPGEHHDEQDPRHRGRRLAPARDDDEGGDDDRGVHERGEGP
jgi:hypothetical protein